MGQDHFYPIGKELIDYGVKERVKSKKAKCTEMKLLKTTDYGNDTK